MFKVKFHYAHYTRDFRKREVLVEDGTLTMEFRDDDVCNIGSGVDRQMENMFLRVLSRFKIEKSVERDSFGRIKPDVGYAPFGCHGFTNVDTDIRENPKHVWENELGRKGEGDFIRMTSTFPPDIHKRYAQEWDDYMDYLSMPAL